MWRQMPYDESHGKIHKWIMWNHMIVRTVLQSKLVISVGIPDMDPQLDVIQKSMVVDSSPKLTHSDWIEE